MSKRFLSGINVTGTATLNTVANAGLDTDKFLVLDAAGNIDFRTGDELKLDIGANVVSRIEHEVKLGETMTIGTPVYIGVDLNAGTNMTVYKATNATEAGSSKTIGLIASSGITNDLVEVVTEGLLEGLNTSTATKGDPVWLGVNGALLFGLANKPVAPAHMVFLGIVTRVQQNNGEIFVKVQNGFEMSEIHNYLQGNVQNNEVIVYDSATSLYKPKSIPTILGYTPVPDSRTITINGTTYDLSANRSWTISANQNARTEYEFTTNGSTATYSATYTIGQVDVFYNGSKLSSAEFTATNGTSVTLAFTPPTGQMVEIVAWETGGGVANGRTLTINGTTYDLSANRSWTIDNASLGAQPQLNGTGFVKVSGTTVTYDNSTYLTTSSAASTYLTTASAASTYLTTSAAGTTYLPKTGGVLTGALGINSNGLTGYSFRNSRNLTGFSTTYANYADGQIQADATGLSHYFYSESNVAAGASIAGIYHFKATQNIFGAGSFVGVQAGLVIDFSVSGASVNYGIISNITDGTDNWNLYIGGLAKNYIASSLGIGTNTPEYKLDVVGTGRFSGDLTLNNGAADGAQLVLASSGYSNWNIDNYSGSLRAYYGASVALSIASTGAATFSSSITATTATFNPNASSILTLTSAGTNASMIRAGAGDELYIGGNDTWQMRFSSGNILMDNGGNVSIGTSAIGYKLFVSTTGTGAFNLNSANSTVGAPMIDFYDTGRLQETVISSYDGGTVGTYIASYSNHPLMFGANAGVSPTAKMTIAPNGNVGIATVSPTSPLHIGVNTSGNYKLTHWGEPGFTANYGLILRGDSSDGVFKFYGLNNGSESGAPLFSMNRASANSAFGTSTTSTNSRLNVNGSVKINRSIYNWYQAGWQGNGTYWHMKTNMSAGLGGNIQYTMSLFKGYMYSYSDPSVREGSYGFHNWDGVIYNPASSGNLFVTAYRSSDNFVVLVIPSGNGETGVTIDWHQAFGYPFVEAVVTNASLHGATTGRY